MNPKKTCIVLILVLIAPLLTGAYCLAMPKAEGIELPNHLKLLVFEEHSIPIVTLELLTAAGSVRDPQDMRGLANLTAKSLMMGTRFLSFDQLNERLDFIGSGFDVDCSRDFAMIGMQVLKKDLGEGVGLFAEVIIHPSFPAADVDGQKDDIIGSLRAKEDDPVEVASRAFDKALFLDNAYAGPLEGTEKSVAAMNTENISKFYASFYRPNDSVLVIGGDITLQEVKTLIVPILSEWQAGEGRTVFPKGIRRRGRECGHR
ncbi:Peptidase M16 domain protein (fragment) [Syntrophobacter sp. SbD2]